MTTTTEQSPATVRKAKAQAALQRLTTEQKQIIGRRQTAEATIERLTHDIIGAERSGEPDTLASLRTDRQAAQESVLDLARVLPVVDRDIQLAEGELHAATAACHAEDWNKIQAKQVALLKTIGDAINTIVSAITDKERLAHRQQKILTSVCPGHNRNPDAIQHEISHAIAEQLQGRPATGLRGIDWSSWAMIEQGDLLK